MDVILFPKWRVHSYLDEKRRNVILSWLDQNHISGPDRSALQALIDICEYSGPHALAACTEDLGNDFFALYSRRKGGPEIALVFCYGPVGDTEITFLAGAFVEGGRFKPNYVAGIAEENLEALRKDPRRKRRERFG